MINLPQYLVDAVYAAGREAARVRYQALTGFDVLPEYETKGADEVTQAALTELMSGWCEINNWDVGVEKRQHFRLTIYGSDKPKQPDDREPSCVERWPECQVGAYDPRCCRFPKSCSCWKNDV